MSEKYPWQLLKAVGYVFLDPCTFIKVSGTTMEFPESGVPPEYRPGIMQDALVAILAQMYVMDKKDVIGAVKAAVVNLAIAPANEIERFRCSDFRRRAWNPNRYAFATDQVSEGILLEEVAAGRDPRRDAWLKRLFGREHVAFFMHMRGFGIDVERECVPCRTDVEAERALRRAQESTECSYLVFDRKIDLLEAARAAD